MGEGALEQQAAPRAGGPAQPLTGPPPHPSKSSCLPLACFLQPSLTRGPWSLPLGSPIGLIVHLSIPTAQGGPPFVCRSL